MKKAISFENQGRKVRKMVARFNEC